MISTIRIEHGETTCASVPGKFCRFLGAKNFGTVPVCMLFNNNLHSHNDGPFKGWIARCVDCHVEFDGEDNA